MVNDVAGFNDLIPTLLVFGAYPRMYSIDPPALTIIQRATAIKKAIEQVRKIRAKNEVINALNTRNGLLLDLVYNLLLNFNVLVLQKDNARRTGKWIDPFNFLGIESKIYKIYLLSGPIKFWSTIIKYYFVDNDNTKNYSLPIADFLSLT